MRAILLLIVLMGQQAAGGDDKNAPPIPVADTKPNEALPFNGPIERKLEAIAERFGGTSRQLDEVLQRQTEMQGILDRWRDDGDDDGRSGMLGQLVKMREDVQAIRSERNGLIARFSELKKDIEYSRNEYRGILRKWTPLQNLVERLTGLVYKLVGLVIAVCVFCFLMLIVGAIVWRKVNAIPSRIADAVTNS